MPRSLTLLARFDRLNRRHFRGRLKRPSMVRFSKRPDPSHPGVVGFTRQKGDGRAYILIHEALKPFDTLVDFILVHEMVHLWCWARGIMGADICRKLRSPHHRRMLLILGKEVWLC